MSEAAPDPADVDAVLRLAAAAPAADPVRRHALALVRSHQCEPPPEWWGPLYVPIAWCLVAKVLEVAPEGTVVERGEHSGGQHEDIVIWHRDDERWPALYITLTSGVITCDRDTRALCEFYPGAFITRRASLERAVCRRFEGALPGVSSSRIAAAYLMSLLTDLPRPLGVDPPTDSVGNQAWSLRRPDIDIGIRVDMAEGSVCLSDGERWDASRALPEGPGDWSVRVEQWRCLIGIG